MSLYRIGPFELHVERLITTCDGKPLAFGPKVTETLLALAEHAGTVRSKAELLDRIWPDGFVEEANLTQNIYVLRKAFRRHGYPDAIQTVARQGYRLAVPAVLVDNPPLAVVPARRAPMRPALFRRVAAVGVAAASIAAMLLTAASGGPSSRALVESPLSARGARLYSLGTYFWNERTRDGVRKSLGYFTQVVETDPTNPLGYAGLADANATVGSYCYGSQAPAVYFARARAYAKQALTLDADSAEAHAVLGLLALQGSNVRTALPELQRAIAIKPRYAPAQEWYGIALVEEGRLADGLSHLKTASAIDPLSVATAAWLGIAAYQAHQFDESIAYGKEALELSPQRADALATIGKAYEARGDLGLAIETFKQFAASSPYHRAEAAALLAKAFALQHRIGEAHAQYAYAIANAMSADPSDLGDAAAAIGDKAAAQRLRHASMHMFWLA